MATYGTFVNNVSLKFSEVNDFFTAQTEPSPVLTQGVSVTYANDRLMAFYKVNKFVNGNFFFNVTGTGTLGSRIEVSLPVTAASSSVRLIGEALISDISALQYRVCRIVQISTTRMAFLTDTATSLTTYLGQTNGPNIRLASNDILLGSFRYEAA